VTFGDWNILIYFSYLLLTQVNWTHCCLLISLKWELVKSIVNVVKMLGGCQFNDSWTLSDQHAHWISRTKDVHKARCTLCLEDIDLSCMGESPWQLMSESLKVVEKYWNFIFFKQVGTFRCVLLCRWFSGWECIRCVKLSHQNRSVIALVYDESSQ